MDITNQLQSLLYQLMTSVQTHRETDRGQPEPTWVYPGPDPAGSPAWKEENQPGRKRSFDALIEKACQKHRVSPDLVRAVIKAESNGNPKAVSRSGAQGLMQLMPATASSLGVEDPFDPRQNINGGVRLLRQLMNRYQGDLDLTLAAYNAGTVAVDRHQGIPPFRETQVYVPRVKKYLRQEQSWKV